MIVVAVIRGGASDEHDVSLKTGAEVLRHLQREPYRAVDIYIDRSGQWHMRGVPMTPERALGSVDVVFNALHGRYGEDGEIQRLLSLLSIPYTGSGPLASGLAMNKPTAKAYVEKIGVLVPRHIILSVSSDLKADALSAYRKFSPPVIIKPIASGSSIGVTLATTFDDFWEGLKVAFAYSPQVMVEEFIPGREATAGILEEFRSSPYYTLLPIEVDVPTWGIYSSEAKKTDSVTLRVPGHFTRDESQELEHLARKVHKELGLSQYSRSDFVVSKRGTYFLEANSLPALSEGSSFTKSLDAVGVTLDELIDHLLGLALKK